MGSDRDVAALQVAALQVQRRSDMQVIRAPRETQIGHGRTLEEHSKVLGALVSGQVAMMEHLKAITDRLGITPPGHSSEE